LPDLHHLQLPLGKSGGHLVAHLRWQLRHR
jgi:hypothetical protein